MERIENPKIGRKLPHTLSLNEIDRMVKAIDLSNVLGERNRAILETLYSCGLRVSELTNLKISDLFFAEGFIKVTGKGNKQRFVPIGGITKKYINLCKLLYDQDFIVIISTLGRCPRNAHVFSSSSSYCLDCQIAYPPT